MIDLNEYDIPLPLRIKLERQQELVRRLRRALKRYGGHLPWCEKWLHKPCTCGYAGCITKGYEKHESDEALPVGSFPHEES